MPIYRYIYDGLDDILMQKKVPGTPSVNGWSPKPLIDISLSNSSYKSDLDDFMLEQGYIYLSTNPITSIDNAFIASMPNFVSIKQTIISSISVNRTTTSVIPTYDATPLFSQSITTISGTKLNIRLTTSGSTLNNNRGILFRLRIDGVTKKIMQTGSSVRASFAQSGALEHVESGLSAGSHTITVDWCVSSATTGQIRPITSPNTEAATLVLQEVLA